MDNHFGLQLSTKLFVSDRHVEGTPLLTSGPAGAPSSWELAQMHAHVQPIFHATDTALDGVIDATASEISISPMATDTEILAVLTDCGISVQAIVMEDLSQPDRNNVYHFAPCADVPGAIEFTLCATF